jgi:hypothetical protein
LQANFVLHSRSARNLSLAGMSRAATTAKPGKTHPETSTLKSARPTESDDLLRSESGYRIPGFAPGASPGKLYSRSDAAVR